MERFWNRFFLQIQRDFRLWLFFMLALSLFRLVFVVVFRGQIDAQSGGRDILAAMLNGLRFDSMVSTWWIIPSLVCSVACARWNLQKVADHVRTVCSAAFVVATAVLGCVSVQYFREFNDVFNQFLFKLYEDDTGAILTTIFFQYHLVPYLALMAALIGVGVFVQRRFFAGEFVGESVFRRVANNNFRRNAVSVAILALFVVGVRGSISHRPVQRKDAGVTADPLLNKAVLNPHVALHYAVRDHLQMIGGAGLRTYLPDENVAKACEEAFPEALLRGSVDEYAEKIAAGPKTVPPRHVFLVFAESYDAWPMLDEYKSLGLVEQGRRLAREGLHVKAFLPASDTSMAAYMAMVAGLPHARIPTHCAASAQTPYPTSLPDAMRRLGYRTRFFCGGYLSWCNVGELARRQGFQEIYGAGHIGRSSDTNEWGVKDEFLFQFVRTKVPDDAPSFNFVMTCTYHPPYDLDAKAKGFPLTEVPPDLKEKFRNDPQKLLPILGHLWYADRCLGEFVDRTERELSRPLFAVCGDHYARHFINPAPTVFERSAVPLILYGKEVLRRIRLPEGVAGGHIDIPPTLIELAAPKGFHYHSIGRDLLTPQRRFLGFGSEKVIGWNFIVDLSGDPQVGAIPGRELPSQPPDVERLTQLHHSIHGVTWWRVRRGPEFVGPVLVAQTPGGSVRY